MGPQEDYIETVVTCEGDFHDPQLPHRLECFRQRLKDLLITGELHPPVYSTTTSNLLPGMMHY